MRVIVTVPLGLGAYKRSFAGAPEVKLINRFVEKEPTNQREHVALIARPGAALLTTAGTGPIRGRFSKIGLFNGDLFIVSGNSLYRYSLAGSLTQIPGFIASNGFVYQTWMAGIGYQYLYISDGANLQYYTTHARGVLTLSGGDITSQVIQIGPTFYGWASNVNPATVPNGTSAAPYLAALGTNQGSPALNDALSLSNMADLINSGGVAGVTYSASVTGPDPNVSAIAPDTGATLQLTAIVDGAQGNTIATAVTSGSFLSFASATLTGGGGTQLTTVPLPNPGEVPKAIAAMDSYVFVSVADSNKFYWINPGETQIHALNFASKESAPDPIVDMLGLGDTLLIMGQESCENWHATGDVNSPFAPVQGQLYNHGIIDGTPVIVRDSVFVVGDDGVVYEIGYGWGKTAQYGVNRVSDNGIEERVRTQLRANQGWPP